MHTKVVHMILVLIISSNSQGSDKPISMHTTVSLTRIFDVHIHKNQCKTATQK